MTEWRRIDGFDYEVSDDGLVRRCGSLKFLSPSFSYSSNGKYKRVTLVDDAGKQHKKLIHRLMLAAFVGPSEGRDGCHRDGDSENNALSNLRWDTRKGNLADRHIHGTSFVGERNPRSKLSEKDVIAIKKRLGEGEAGIKIASDFGVSNGLVGHIKHGRAWAHVSI